MSEHPELKSQVFKHWGRTSGHGAVVTGPLVVVVVATSEVTPSADDAVAGASDVGLTVHLVQTVDVLVMMTVEVETPVSTLVTPSEV